MRNMLNHNIIFWFNLLINYESTALIARFIFLVFYQYLFRLKICLRLGVLTV